MVHRMIRVLPCEKLVFIFFDSPKIDANANDGGGNDDGLCWKSKVSGLTIDFVVNRKIFESFGVNLGEKSTSPSSSGPAPPPPPDEQPLVDASYGYRCVNIFSRQLS